MSFDNPRLLLFLFALIPLALLLLLLYRRRRKWSDLFVAAAPAGERDALKHKFRSRMIYADCLFILFLFFCIFALGGPRWGKELVPDYSRGVDIVYAIDLSRSMSVRDCPPLPGKTELSSRMENAISMAYNLGVNLDGMRIGAAIGKGRGILALPLSYDSEAILNFLAGTNDLSITGTGTNLESLIDASSTAFKDNMPGRRVIILFSDGEELTGSINAAVSRARSRGIIICAVGIGSDEGGRIPTGEDSVLISLNGLPVISSRNSEALKKIADISGGVYTDGNSSEAVSMLGNFLRSLSVDSGLMGRRWETKSRSHIFVFAALLSLGLSRLLGFEARRKKPAAVSGALCLVFLLGLLPFLAASCSNIEGKLYVMEGNFRQNRGDYNEAVSSYLKALDYPDSALYAEYGLGSAYFAMEENAAALERYNSAEESLSALPKDNHTELRFRLKYNLGIIYFEQGDYEKAADAFRHALETDGSRVDAKRNLELSLLSLSISPHASSLRDDTEEDPESIDEENEASLVLFDYLRKKEQELWKSREWKEETGPSGLDY